MWGYTRELLKRFREEIVQSHGGIRCREIAGVDWTNREQVQSFYNGEKFRSVLASSWYRQAYRRTLGAADLKMRKHVAKCPAKLKRGKIWKQSSYWQ